MFTFILELLLKYIVISLNSTKDILTNKVDYTTKIYFILLGNNSTENKINLCGITNFVIIYL